MFFSVVEIKDGLHCYIITSLRLSIWLSVSSQYKSRLRIIEARPFIRAQDRILNSDAITLESLRPNLELLARHSLTVRYMTQQQLQCCVALHNTKHHLNVRSCSQISPFLAHAHFDPILQFHSVIWPRVEYSFIITAAVLLQSESQGKAMHCGCGFKYIKVWFCFVSTRCTGHWTCVCIYFLLTSMELTLAGVLGRAWGASVTGLTCSLLVFM